MNYRVIEVTKGFVPQAQVKEGMSWMGISLTGELVSAREDQLEECLLGSEAMAHAAIELHKAVVLEEATTKADLERLK